MSDKDRTEICDIISEMLDNPDKVGIFPTGTAYTKLELYVEAQRTEAIGWTWAKACTLLDKGSDPRTHETPKLLADAQKDFSS